ncbi:hypothetical protein ADK53_28045 [Streptomyces sp. WM6373]|nr:hypothetical protein ADK53_28045 [Streptomyces sp. WM6373]KOU62441.1 hypothetical protein ADK96_26560 [Streptomyces sp. IGB124]KOU72380.1 hypothetical protein ADK61_27130 [Streptomyces sp. XY66]KOV34280.1 hypothetical protein ADK97_15605 [Streptomyces sp. H021]
MRVDRCDDLVRDGGGVDPSAVDRPVAIGRMGEELLELVDDQQNALAARLGREPLEDGRADPVGACPGQPCPFDLYPYK